MEKTRYILAGGLIDGSDADVRRNVYLAVRDTVITAIGSAAELRRDDQAEIIDFSHCTIVPALVDCSVSLARSPSVGWRVKPEETGLAEKRVLLERHAGYCHAHGILGVADSGDTAGLPEDQKARMEQEGLITIRTSGVDFLRIVYSGNVGDEEAQGLRLDFADLRRILRQRVGKKTVVVANGPQQVAEALAAGCDALEQGYGMGGDNLRQMAAQDVLWIPGVLQAKNGLDGAAGGGDVCCRFSTRYVAPGKALPGAEAFWKKMLAEQLEQLHRARTSGVKTAVGTGAGSVGILHGESVVEEMKLFIKAGYSLVEAIQCASKNGADFFGMENLGPLAVGRKATFLIARGTARQLPRKLSYLEGIYINGSPSVTYSK